MLKFLYFCDKLATMLYIPKYYKFGMEITGDGVVVYPLLKFVRLFATQILLCVDV